MESFKIAAVQMNALRGDLDHNLAVHDRFARAASQAGCRLVMFPELSVTAHFDDDDATLLAEPTDRGRIYETMREMAKELNIVVSYGFCEQAHGTFYNAQALVGPEGLVGVQRKVHASRDEYFHFRMGRGFEVFDLGFCRVGTLICFDMVLFESWRVMSLKGADVLLLPHAGRSGSGVELPRRKQEQALRRVLNETTKRVSLFSSDNALFSVFANQWGYNGHSTHGGGAYVVGPDGKTLVCGEPTLEDLMITAELSPDLLHAARNGKNAPMKMRRPEVYGEIVRMV